MSDTDILIIGSGIAGTTVALRASRDPSSEITIITGEREASTGATRLAQGGIVGSVSDPELLVADILAAGAGASSVEAARILAYEGPALVREVLVEGAGVDFDRTSDGSYELAHEAAHSERRVLHRADTTGEEIEAKMLATLRSRRNVTIVTSCTAIDLIIARNETARCVGAYVLRDGVVTAMTARATVIATGGVGALYLRTTNPPTARGDGIAMAARAGARIAGAEYIQFHPTACALCESEPFLISESVRGEGARLLSLSDGQPFMQRYNSEWGDLAPRDVVARSIHDRMIADGAPHVLLDLASHMSAPEIRTRFPGIDEHCRSHGVDMAHEPIPVRPAAHYSCGGIAVDEWSRSTIAGLYAVGEASSTGVHGANRLASTSLLEGVVWGCRAAHDIVRDRQPAVPVHRVDIPDIYRGAREASVAMLDSLTRAAREVMWTDVGLVRTRRGLRRAVRELGAIAEITGRLFARTTVTSQTIAARNASRASLVIARAAAANSVSRGCHFITADTTRRQPHLTMHA